MSIPQGQDPFFNQLVGGALGAAWGSSGSALAPGAVSTQAGYLNSDLTRGGFAPFFPQPTLQQGQSYPGALNMPPLVQGSTFPGPTFTG